MSDTQYDIIVLGYGSAGANAALQASQKGAKVLIIDKANKPGGNSFVSSANMTMPTDFHKRQKSDGTQFSRYLQEVSQNTTPKQVIDAYIEGLYEVPTWLQELGGQLEENRFERIWTYNIPAITFPKLQSAEGLDLRVYHVKRNEHCPAPTSGRRVWELLDSRLKQIPSVDIRTGVIVRQIKREEGGAVIGIILDSGVHINAKAVVIACGGFANNPELRRDTLGPRDIGLLGSCENTGDGIRLTQSIGAKLWHMSAEVSVLGFQPPESRFGFALALRHSSFIILNRHGKRFIDETHLKSHRGHLDTAALDKDSGMYEHDPMWLITDSANVETEKTLVLDIFSSQIVNEGYKWSPKSEEELKKGWIKKAESLAALSASTGLPQAELVKTLSEFNDADADDVFGRRKDSMTRISAPYYAIPIKPLLYNTQGGPQRNHKAQILDPEDKPIPGLYGAGECGSIWGHSYQSGCNFAETIVFGRIAGAEAAKYALAPQVDLRRPNNDSESSVQVEKNGTKHIRENEVVNMNGNTAEIVSSVPSVPVTFQRKPFVQSKGISTIVHAGKPIAQRQVGNLKLSTGTARANIAPSEKSPHGTTEGGWAAKHSHQTVLQQHCDFFDVDGDGIIWPSDTFHGFHKLGFGIFLSILAVAVIHLNFAYPTQKSWIPDPRLLVHIDRIHKDKHGSDTGAYDGEGRFVPQNFENIFAKFADGRDYITGRDLMKLWNGQRVLLDPIGWGGALFECKSFFQSAAHV
jgi:peroxygenase